jgi:RHS repeat-associated protein
MTLTLAGAGFAAGTTVELVAADNSVIPAEIIDIDSLTQITAKFPAGIAPGVYSVRVSRPGVGTDALPSAFTITAGGVGQLETNLVLPSSLGRHAVATLYVEYANRGDVAIPAPLLVLESGDPDNSDRPLLTLDQSRVVQGFWTSAIPDGFANSVQFLAGGTIPGTLQPGESARMPVYFVGLQQPWNFADAAVEFNLRVLATDEPATIDWNALNSSMRPPSIPADAWEPIFANLASQVGDTWGDYVRMLDENAAYLGRLGQSVLDVGQLWAFEMQQAVGLNAVGQLASAVDCAVPAPGIALSFSRIYAESLVQRYAMGPLGRGWSTPWQTRLEKEPDGSVNILGASGARRRFQPDSRGGFFTQPGDYAKLTMLAGGPFRLREQSGSVTVFSADGKLDYVEDTSGNRITAGYSAGRLTSLTHSSGPFLALAYNAAGLIESVTTSDGRQARFTYDAAGEHLIAVLGYDGQITRYTYDTGHGAAREHALLSIEAPDGRHQFFAYDQQGRLASTSVEGNSELVTYAYDATGKVAITDATGAAGKLLFDHRGLVVKTEDPLGRSTFSIFDEKFNLTRQTDAIGQAVTFRYDAQGNVVETTDQLGFSTLFTHGTPFSKLTSFTDARGNTTRYEYNSGGNLTATIFPNYSAEQQTFDPLGNPLSYVNRRGQTIAYQHNAAGQITRETFDDGTHVDFTYDGRGNLLTATDARGPTLFEYDTADRMTKVTYPAARSLTFDYDAAGRRTRLTTHDGFVTNYLYDSVGRLWKLTDAADAVIVTYSYDPAGRLARKDNGNGTFTTYEYDPAGQLLHLVNFAPGGAVNSRFDYAYDLLGRRIRMATLDGTWNYSYDATGQLIRAVLASTNPQILSQDLTYVYDAVGNRVRTIENGVTTEYTSNSLNQYMTAGGSTLTYDADGNLISKVSSGGNVAYAYDVQNRLVTVVTPLGNWAYEYDSFGNRIATENNSQRSEYLLDPTGLVDTVAEYNGVSQPISSYVHGLGLSALIDAVGSVAYYDLDAAGSVAGLTGLAGDEISAFTYLPFGQSLATVEGLRSPFQFIGQFGVMNEGNALSLMRARFYDSELARFTSIDPIGLSGGQANLYSYVRNDPIIFSDPRGLLIPNSIDRNRDLPDDERYVGLLDLRHFEAARQTAIKLAPLGPVASFVATNLLGYGVEVAQLFADPHSAFNGSDLISNWIGGLSGVLTPFCTMFPGICDDVDFDFTWDSISFDPNEKSGATGIGSARFISASAELPYRVEFENDASATAPAQRVVITDQLDPDLDWSTFQLTELGFGDRIILVPPGRQYFETTVEMTFNGKTIEVQIEAGIRPVEGEVFAIFQSIDPGTFLPPDVLTGFLPPEDGTGRGMGHVSYMVRPKTGLATGTEIRNIALITFDVNGAIATNQVDPHDPSQSIASASAKPVSTRPLSGAAASTEPTSGKPRSAAAASSARPASAAPASSRRPRSPGSSSTGPLSPHAARTTKRSKPPIALRNIDAFLTRTVSSDMAPGVGRQHRRTS